MYWEKKKLWLFILELSHLSGLVGNNFPTPLNFLRKEKPVPLILDEK